MPLLDLFEQSTIIATTLDTRGHTHTHTRQRPWTHANASQEKLTKDQHRLQTHRRIADRVDNALAHTSRPTSPTASVPHSSCLRHA